MKVVVVGTGFVGVTSSVVYASFGNQVVGLDRSEEKVAALSQGQVPFYEPKLTEMLRTGLDSGHLSFTTDYQQAITGADVVIIAVGTPSQADGSINLDYITSSVTSAAPYLADGVVLAIKSTVLPGTLAHVKSIVQAATQAQVHYASLPEFLKEGTAVDDTLYPDRIVIGVEDDHAYQVLQRLHAPLKAPMLRVLPESAQLAKYASNDYLALRIVYANLLADICAHSGADIDEVIKIMGYEQRIGDHYWYPGLGYGGSCFPKDVKALAAYCHDFFTSDQNLFAFINGLNTKRPTAVIEGLAGKINGFAGKQVAVLGLSFKPNTDDQREAPALSVIPTLLQQDAQVVSYDPMVVQIADDSISANPAYRQVETINQAVEEADVIIALVEWPQIVGFDFTKTKLDKPQVFFDARNQFDAKTLTAAGYQYIGIGRQPKDNPSCVIF